MQVSSGQHHSFTMLPYGHGWGRCHRVWKDSHFCSPTRRDSSTCLSLPALSLIRFPDTYLPFHLNLWKLQFWYFIWTFKFRLWGSLSRLWGAVIANISCCTPFLFKLPNYKSILLVGRFDLRMDVGFDFGRSR